MYPKLLSVLAGGILTAGWLLGAPKASAQDRVLEVRPAVVTTEAPVVLVNHGHHYRNYHRGYYGGGRYWDGGGSVYVGGPGYYSYPNYAYGYSYPRAYYYPRYYYAPQYTYDAYPYYGGSYLYYRW